MGDKSKFAVDRGGGEGASTTYCNIYVNGLGEADFSRFHEIEFSYPN